MTPHPLFHPDPKTAASKQSKLLALSDSSGATGSVFLPFSMYQTSEEDDSSAAPHSRLVHLLLSLNSPITDACPAAVTHLLYLFYLSILSMLSMLSIYPSYLSLSKR